MARSNFSDTNNATNCSDAFSVSYGGTNIPLLTLNNMTVHNLHRALNNLSSIKEEGLVDVTAYNRSVFRITFNFGHPDRTKMLYSNFLTPNGTKIKITRLQKGIQKIIFLLDQNFFGLTLIKFRGL